MNLSKSILLLVVLVMVASVTACSDLTGTGETQGAGAGQLFEKDAASNAENRQPGDAANLDGTQWLLISLNGNNLLDGSRISLNFVDGFVNGFAGCNKYRSLIIGTDEDQFKYTATEDETLVIPKFMITEKDCPESEGVMQQERAYVEALRNGSAYRMIDDRLEIQNASGETILVFVSKEGFQADPGDLVDTEWVLTLLNGERLVEGTNITLNFSDDQARGFAGCNAYGGPYTAAGRGTLTILEIAVTAQGCLEPEGVLQQEDAYIAALTGADAYRVLDDRLEIEDASGETTLVFARKEQFPMDPGDLVGTRWQLVAWDGGSPIEGATITLVFLNDSQIEGHAGCRDYVASYEASGDDIRFPYLGMTGSVDSCSEALMLQESDYTTELELVTNYRLGAGQLELLTARGEVLLFDPL
jgi:heat shock protein HslJ